MSQHLGNNGPHTNRDVEILSVRCRSPHLKYRSGRESQTSILI